VQLSSFSFRPVESAAPKLKLVLPCTNTGTCRLCVTSSRDTRTTLDLKHPVEGPYADLTICSVKATGCNGGDSDRSDWHNSCLHIPAEAFRGLLPWIALANEINFDVQCTWTGPKTLYRSSIDRKNLPCPGTLHFPLPGRLSSTTCQRRT
jgi:hypothetical protein